MKYLLLPAFFLLIGLTGFAQRIHAVHEVPGQVIAAGAAQHPSAKATAAGDTLVLRHWADTTSVVAYTVGADSGYAAGTNYWGDQAFAERYDLSDSTYNVQVVGVLAAFHGHVMPTSSKAVTFTIWSQGAQQYITGSQAYSGFPNTVLDSVSVPVTQLGIGLTTDTFKKHFFSAGTGNIHSSFFVGYSINYDFLALGGDTLGLYSSHNGVRNPSGLYTLSFNISDLGDPSLTPDTTLDTITNVQNATLGSDNIWYDNYTQDDSLSNNLAIFPIVVKGFPAGTKGITRNNFTFYGNYPNPCTSATNIRFALKNSSGVAIDIMDMAGRTITTINEPLLSSGEHTLTVSTASLPAGDYLYLIRTSAGDGIAGKMTVYSN
jgi:Secretion system C-terminal sorting domain